MENTPAAVPAYVQDTLELATWNQPRSLGELRAFVAHRENELDVEDFDV